MKYGRMARSVPMIMLAIIFYSCSAHNPFIVRNTTDTIPVSDVKYQPHIDKVFITSGIFMADKYDLIGFIEVGRIWYGSSSNVLLSLATRARELGADAVIEAKTWHQPSGFSWAAPHGSGKAIKFKNKAEIDFTKINGDWL